MISYLHHLILKKTKLIFSDLLGLFRLFEDILHEGDGKPDTAPASGHRTPFNGLSLSVKVQTTVGLSNSS